MNKVLFVVAFAFALMVGITFTVAAETESIQVTKKNGQYYIITEDGQKIGTSYWHQVVKHLNPEASESVETIHISKIDNGYLIEFRAQYGTTIKKLYARNLADVARQLVLPERADNSTVICLGGDYSSTSLHNMCPKN